MTKRSSKPVPSDITTARQYQVTKAQTEKFEAALRQAEARSYSDPLLAKLERDAYRSQLETLRGQLAEYEMNRLSQAQLILREPVIHERRKGAATGGTVEFVIVSRKAWDAAKDLADTAAALWSSQQEEQGNG